MILEFIRSQNIKWIVLSHCLPHHDEESRLSVSTMTVGSMKRMAYLKRKGHQKERLSLQETMKAENGKKKCARHKSGTKAMTNVCNQTL